MKSKHQKIEEKQQNASKAPFHVGPTHYDEPLEHVT